MLPDSECTNKQIFLLYISRHGVDIQICHMTIHSDLSWDLQLAQVTMSQHVHECWLACTTENDLLVSS